jgi:HEAT repeat protein
VNEQELQKLISELQHGDKFSRRKAAEALGKNDSPRALKPLIAALKDKRTGYGEDEVRLFAARALGKIDDRRTVKPLIAALKDKAWSVRSVAAWVLGEIGDPRAVKPLLAAAKDKEYNVRSSAIKALRLFKQTSGARVGAVIQGAIDEWDRRESELEKSRPDSTEW